MSWGVTPGPINNELLFFASEHIVAHHFQNPHSDAGILGPRWGDEEFWKHVRKILFQILSSVT